VVRSVGLGGKGEVETIIGYECRDNLFDFGDTDGIGKEVRLQHALGVAFHDGKLYVADTYNSKIKVVDPAKRSCTTLVGGEREGWLAGPVFNEPGGLSAAGDKLFIADTNAHRIRLVDLKTKTVSTLKLQGVDAPKLKTP
jgi:DNA-binding beta-propeller fold protein YncE